MVNKTCNHESTSSKKDNSFVRAKIFYKVTSDINNFIKHSEEPVNNPVIGYFNIENYETKLKKHKIKKVSTHKYCLYHGILNYTDVQSKNSVQKW